MNYRSVHFWVERNFGKAHYCEICGKNEPNKNKKRTFSWANRSGKYLKERSDWIMTCYSCHKKMDFLLGRWKPWNKDKKGVQVGFWKNKKLTFVVWNKGKTKKELPQLSGGRKYLAENKLLH